MENRRKLVGDLERYDALLRLTTDHQAITAIEQLIRETRDRLNELEKRIARFRVGDAQRAVAPAQGIVARAGLAGRRKIMERSPEAVLQSPGQASGSPNIRPTIIPSVLRKFP